MKITTREQALEEVRELERRIQNQAQTSDRTAITLGRGVQSVVELFTRGFVAGRENNIPEKQDD